MKKPFYYKSIYCAFSLSLLFELLLFLFDHGADVAVSNGFYSLVLRNEILTRIASVHKSKRHNPVSPSQNNRLLGALHADISISPLTLRASGRGSGARQA
jgi:hypothetical protein